MNYLRHPIPLKEAAINCTLKAVFGSPAPYVQTYLDRVRHVARHEGPINACKYMKDLYVQAIHIAVQRTFIPIPFRKSDSKGQAKDLRPFLSDLHSDDPNSKRKALTVLRLCYLIHSEAKVDVTPIVTPALEGWNDEQWTNFKEFTTRVVSPMKIEEKIMVVPRARSGPNGPSSLLSSHLDAVALTNSPSLLNSLDSLASLIQSDFGLKDWVVGLSDWTKQNFKNLKVGSLNHSRLIGLPEGGCKTRTIAIGDLFTQAVLLPIHKTIMSRLARLDQDGTFDQSKSIQLVIGWTKKGPLYSFDLSNATDRFPVELTRIVIAQLFGEKFSEHWKDVMTDRDFSLRTRHQTRVLRYAAGQPMGLYSSWPAFAYSHHILLQWCANEVGVYPFQDYTIIGDDIVIAHPAVASKYRTTLEDFGVSISESKSMVSEHPPYHGEICKQILLNGVNISPIPPDLIQVASKSELYLPALLNEIRNRYGTEFSVPSRLSTLKLVDYYSRNSKRARALILLTAPVVFAHIGEVALYGQSPNAVTSSSQELQQALRASPWGKLEAEVLPDIPLIQEQLRKVVLLRQYETSAKEWHDLETEPPVVNGVELFPKGTLFDGIEDGANLRSHFEANRPKHPIEHAADWVQGKLNGIFRYRIAVIGREDDVSFEELGLRYTLDPKLRSYQDRRLVESKSTSHLTLETFKVLKGELPYPMIEHPAGGILETHTRMFAH